MSVTDTDQADVVFCEVGSYKYGQYKNIKTNNFSLEKAVAATGFRETKQTNYGWDRERFYGISAIDKGIFAISSKIKTWEFTVFHELGHLFLEQPELDWFELEVKHKGVAQDLEADLFSYFCLTSLGLEEKTKDPIMGHRFYGVLEQNKNWEGLPSNKRIEEIKQKAKEFLALGEIN